MHAIDSLVFEEQLVILGDGHEEEYSGNVLETMYPFLSFGSLSANVEHAVCEVTNNEGGLGDTGRLDTGPKDVLIVGDVIWLCYALDRVKVAGRTSVSRNESSCCVVTYYFAESFS